MKYPPFSATATVQGPASRNLKKFSDPRSCHFGLVSKIRPSSDMSAGWVIEKNNDTAEAVGWVAGECTIGTPTSELRPNKKNELGGVVTAVGAMVAPSIDGYRERKVRTHIDKLIMSDMVMADLNLKCGDAAK